jgi:hypothetical protein
MQCLVRLVSVCNGNLVTHGALRVTLRACLTDYQGGGLTAGWACWLTARIWWPIHKLASVSLVLVWLHGVYAGGDSAALLVLYIVSGVLVVAVAISCYTARGNRARSNLRCASRSVRTAT